MASRKVDLALAIRAAVGDFANNVQRIQELDEIFIRSGYDATGSDPITDADVAPHDMTAADLAAFHTFTEELEKFLSNQVPAQADYWSTIYAFRQP